MSRTNLVTLVCDTQDNYADSMDVFNIKPEKFCLESAIGVLGLQFQCTLGLVEVFFFAKVNERDFRVQFQVRKFHRLLKNFPNYF